MNNVVIDETKYDYFVSILDVEVAEEIQAITIKPLHELFFVNSSSGH